MVRRKKASRLLSAQNRNPTPRDIVMLENDLFREASTLSATAGANVAVISRRPSGEVRLWGSPSAPEVLSQYRLYSGRRISPEAPSEQALVLAAEERAQHYVEFMRQEEELTGMMPPDRTAEEQCAIEKEWIIDFLGSEIERVQMRIRELAAVSSDEQSPAPGSHAQSGV